MHKVKKPIHLIGATGRSSGTITRRGFMGATIGGAAALAAPGIVRAQGSSGELKILCWAEEMPEAVVKLFTEQTGIQVSITPFSSNEEQMNKLMATGGVGFDLCNPTIDRAVQFMQLGVLQPIDVSRINFDGILPSMRSGVEAWATDDGYFALPHMWGTEAIGWRSDKTTLRYDTLSYGTLWEAEYVGAIQGKPDTLLLGIGLWFDANGRLSSNRMLDSYKDEATMRRIYDELLAFAIEHKRQVRQFILTSDAVKSGFMENGCSVGQVWDGPALQLRREGKPVRYMAPQEGAQSWIDGLSMSARAQNTEQAYELLKFLYTPEISAMLVVEAGYNGVMKDATQHLPTATQELFAECYPGDALDNLWPRPEEPGWYGAVRNEYAERFQAA